MNLDQLKDQFNEDQILTDSKSLETYGKDWTKHFTPNPLLFYFQNPHNKSNKLLNGHSMRRSHLCPLAEGPA